MKDSYKELKKQCEDKLKEMHYERKICVDHLCEKIEELEKQITVLQQTQKPPITKKKKKEDNRSKPTPIAVAPTTTTTTSASAGSGEWGLPPPKAPKASKSHPPPRDPRKKTKITHNRSYTNSDRIMPPPSPKTKNVSYKEKKRKPSSGSSSGSSRSRSRTYSRSRSRSRGRHRRRRHQPTPIASNRRRESHSRSPRRVAPRRRSGDLHHPPPRRPLTPPSPRDRDRMHPSRPSPSKKNNYSIFVDDLSALTTNNSLKSAFIDFTKRYKLLNNCRIGVCKVVTSKAFGKYGFISFFNKKDRDDLLRFIERERGGRVTVDGKQSKAMKVNRNWNA